jgi:hypothetical protein
MSDTLYRKVYKKITQDMPREEKEQIVYKQLMKIDRVFIRNVREGDLFNYYGSEIAQKFIQQIKNEENELGRRLNASEIENKYQEILGSLKNGNGRIH